MADRITVADPKFAAALVAGKLCAAFCRAFFPKRGSNLPGEIALRIDPLFLRHVRGIDPAKTIFITGTNGKSTANNMIVHAFRSAGRTVCSNLEGANMKPGAAAALLKNTAAGGRLAAEWLILEVDERSLSLIAKDLPFGQLCVTNIQKDQVQRNGDPDYIYQKIKAAVQGAVSRHSGRRPQIQPSLTLFLNNEEPRSKSLEKHLPEGGRAVSFGVAPNARASSTDPDFGVTMPCPICHDALDFSHLNLAGVGFFRCPACGFCSGETADVEVSGVDYEAETFSALGKTFRLAYPAAFFLYNYALCAAVCSENGIPGGALETAFATFSNIGGRMETFEYCGKTVRYMRIKQENPETLQSAIDTMAEDGREKTFVFGPAVVDDIVPHYTNTFYAFDCDFAPLLESGLAQCVCFGETISWDAANRLRYAGVEDEKITVLGTDDDEKILAAIAAGPTETVYLITWIKKYEQLKEKAASLRAKTRNPEAL